MRPSLICATGFNIMCANRQSIILKLTEPYNAKIFQTGVTSKSSNSWSFKLMGQNYFDAETFCA